MEKIKIVYDIDNTLNNLNEVVYSKLGLKDIKPVWYDIQKNVEEGIITLEQAEKIIKMYGDSDVARSVEGVPGIERLIDIEEELEDICEVYIHSLSFTKEIADFKREWLAKWAPPMEEERWLLDIGRNKKILAEYEVDILVEDCLENLMKSKATIANILIRKSYNNLGTYKLKENDIPNLVIAENLHHALDIIENLCREFKEERIA